MLKKLLRVWVFLVFAAQIAFVVNVTAAFADDAARAANPKRVALLIGNEDYALTIGSLKNSINDVKAMKTSLEKLGFHAIPLENAEQPQIMAAIKEYASELNRAGEGAVGVLYYSGHGMAKPGTPENYIIPTNVTTMDDKLVWEKSIELDSIKAILKRLAPYSSHFLIIDACRTELQLGFKAGSTKSFAGMVDTPGIYVALSTSTGQTALDWPDRENGPYAKVLSEIIQTPGMKHSDVFQNVARKVYELTSEAQQPIVINGLLPDIYFAGEPQPQAGGDNQETKRSSSEVAKRIWDILKNEKDPSVLRKFASDYSDTEYAKEAQQRLRPLIELDQPSPPAPPNSPPPLIESVKSRWPNYLRGDAIYIDVKTQLTQGFTAKATFSFGKNQREVSAKYDVQRKVFSIAYVVPKDAASGSYKVPIDIADMNSQRTQREVLSIEIGLSRAEWSATYLQPSPGQPALIPQNTYSVVVASPEDQYAFEELAQFCSKYPNFNFAMYTSVKSDNSNPRFQIEIAYNLSKESADKIADFARSRRVGNGTYAMRYHWNSHAQNYYDCYSRQ